MIKKFKEKNSSTFVFWLLLVLYELQGLGGIVMLTLSSNYWWSLLLAPAIIFPPIAIMIGVGVNVFLSITIPYFWIIGAPIMLITLIYPLRKKIKS